jgi:HEAT repeat protein
MKDRRTDRGWSDVADDLAKLGPSAVPRLIRALRDNDCMARSVAAWALGKLGDRRAVEPLKELLGDGNADIRKAAAEALKRLRGQSEGKP